MNAKVEITPGPSNLYELVIDGKLFATTWSDEDGMRMLIAVEKLKAWRDWQEH